MTDRAFNDNQSVADLRAIAGQPDRWREIDGETFKLVVFQQCFEYGVTNDTEAVPRMNALYETFVERSPREDRLEVLLQLQESLEHSPGAVNALMPFIFAEPEVQIVSTAALTLAVHLSDESDPLYGPAYVKSLVEQTSEQNTRVGLLVALLVLGDHRMEALLEDSWRLLDDDHRQQLSRTAVPFVHPVAVTFYLNWLETALAEQDEGLFGTAAAGLYNLAQVAEQQDVQEIERKLPVTAPDDRPAVAILESWRRDQYGKMIEPQLRDIADREPDPKVMPMVMQAWGIEP